MKRKSDLDPETIAKLITDDLESNNGVVSEKEWLKVLTEKPLDTETRNALESSSFVFPKDRRFPIQDLSHARNALSRASGTKDEEAVKRAVYAKYPALKKRKED